MAFILKNNRKKDKPFVRRVEVGCTGLDLTYGTEAQAIKFVSFAVAGQVVKALSVVDFFLLVEVDG